MSSSQAAILVFFFRWLIFPDHVGSSAKLNILSELPIKGFFKLYFSLFQRPNPAIELTFFFSCYFNKYEMLSRSISISKCISYTVGKEIPYLRAPMYYSLKLYNFFHRFLKIGIT